MMQMQFKPQTQKDIGMLKKIKNSLRWSDNMVLRIGKKLLPIQTCEQMYSACTDGKKY